MILYPPDPYPEMTCVGRLLSFVPATTILGRRSTGWGRRGGGRVYKTLRPQTIQTEEAGSYKSCVYVTRKHKQKTVEVVNALFI